MESLVEEVAPVPGQAASTVVLVERPASAVDPAQWDGFAQRCGASFLCSWNVVSAERFRHRVRIFELHATALSGQSAKVGQCAIAVARRRVRFLDRLQILPGHEDLWERGVHLIIERCGEATYNYGSLWNQEDRRLRAAPRRAAVNDAILQIDRIGFAEWPDFAAYRRAVSENIRRDYKKAAAASATVTVRHGTAALADLAPFVRLRREVMRRNVEPYSPSADFGRHALKLLCMGADAFIATARTADRCHASFFGVQFGDAFYYLGGGTEDRCQGFGSFLFLTLLEQWFERCPRGALYLGSYVGTPTAKTYTGRNLLYRRKLRAASVAGSSFSLTMV